MNDSGEQNNRIDNLCNNIKEQAVIPQKRKSRPIPSRGKAIFLFFAYITCASLILSVILLVICKIDKIKENYEINIINVSLVKKVSYNNFLNEYFLKDGYEYAVFDIEFNNLSNKLVDIDENDFECYADGILQESVNEYILQNMPLYVDKGKKDKGVLVYMIPIGSTNLEIRYKKEYTGTKKINHF